MRLRFNDLFNDDGDALIAKKSIRIGALVIPDGHTVHPNDPNLGLPLNEWKQKHFEVSMDNNCIVIEKIID